MPCFQFLMSISSYRIIEVMAVLDTHCNSLESVTLYHVTNYHRRLYASLDCTRRKPYFVCIIKSNTLCMEKVP